MSSVQRRGAPDRKRDATFAYIAAMNVFKGLSRM
jgi:hypothetical protein